MDNILINNWNSTISPEDEVWVLGDFGMRKREQLVNHFNRLNGIKNLVLGNHDDAEVMKTFGWNSVQHYAEFYDGDQYVVLSHYPMRTWNHVGHNSTHLFGHCHSDGRMGNQQSTDVGVDAWNYFPVTLEQIKKRLATFLPFVPIDHHGNRDI